MKYRCVLFDCDGTLVDTINDIASAMNRSLTRHGFPVLPVEQYRDIVGWGIFRLAELALPQDARTEETIATVGSCAQRIMGEQPAEESLSKPYSGIRELVSQLRAKKFSLGVLSNKPDPVLRRLMDDLFGSGAFDAICGLRTGIIPKPDPSSVWETLAELGRVPGDTIFLGDSEIDMETARKSGCYPLGVSWGYRSRAVLEASGAAHIIDTPEEIWELITPSGRHGSRD